MSEEINFCTRCGRSLSPNDIFCPECGFRVAKPDPEEQKAAETAMFDAMSSRLKIGVAMMLIYAIPMLILGLYILVDAATITDVLYGAYQEYAGVTEEEIDQLVKWAGYAYLISGVTGCAASALCLKTKAYWVAVTLCIMSMFTGVMGLFALFMGMISFWIVLTSKPLFDRAACGAAVEENE